MPLSKHYGGHGAEVMRNMRRQYGQARGEQIFYATENARKDHPADRPRESPAMRGLQSVLKQRGR